MLRIAILCLLFCGLVGCSLFRQTDAERAAGVDAPGVDAAKAIGQYIADAISGGLAAQLENRQPVGPTSPPETPWGWAALAIGAVAYGVKKGVDAYSRRRALELKQATPAPAE